MLETAEEAPQVSEHAINNLVRLALACEVNKRPLRREQINELVLKDSGGRHFRALLAATNRQLERVFGMELVAVPSTARAASAATVAGRKASLTAKNMTATSANANSFILLNRIGAQECKKIPRTRRADRLGLLASILTMITLSGGSIEHDVLMAKLGSLGIDVKHEIEEWMQELRRQKYLLITRQIDDQNMITYSVGPRAQLEFPPDVLAKFVMEIGAYTQQTQNLAERVNLSFGL